MRLASIVALAVAPALVSIPKGWSPRERVCAERISAPAIAGHVRYLASDLLEGRAPGTRGSQLALEYVAAQMERAGLRPAGEPTKSGAPGWLQHFALVSVSGEPTQPPMLRGPGGPPIELHPGQDAVLHPGSQNGDAKLADAELVFCGYGITAPEQKWDDFKGQDVRGKVLVVMNNDPSSDPKRFAGKTRTYYGRWTYKYEEGARRGAAGVIIIHTVESAGYPWQVVQSSWSGEGFELPSDGEPRVALKMWVTEEVARKIAQLGKRDLDELRRAAESPDFRPVPLGVTMRAQLKTKLRRLESANVIGELPGSDPELGKQRVIVSAHHDHLGVKQAKNGDAIYNGAFDNASGVAGLLELAEALAQARPQPKRTIVFAAVGAEESGLLGSQYLSKHLPVPAAEVAANLNFDGINVYGRTRDVESIGLGRTSLDDVVAEVARAQGRAVVGDLFPDRGAFYRSDQFNFARVGVPVLYLKGGVDFPGHDLAWGRDRVEQYTRERYHQPNDQIDDTWILDGAVDDLRLAAVVTLRIADGKAMPTWTAGDEFAKLRAPK